MVVLEAYLRVPAEDVPLNCFVDFRKTIKDKDGNEINLDFYKFDSNTNSYLFARGDIPLLKKHFGHLPWQDLRTKMTMRSSSLSYPGGSGLQFTGTLRAGQSEVVKQVLDSGGFGAISASPRFGKTITMSYLVCHWQQKTLFLCHQEDLSKQIYQAFLNFTNVLDLEYYAGRQVVGIVGDWSDLDDYDVAIMTYQKFVSGKNADLMLQKYKDSFGVVFVDEMHKASAPMYSKIVSSFNSAVRMGVSGTIERKNQMHIVNEYIIGPVVAVGQAEQIPCTVNIVRTGTKVPYQAGKMFFTYTLNYLAKDRERNKLILSYLIAYHNAGHHIIVVADRTQQCDFLASELGKVGIAAESFHRSRFIKKEDREKCLNRCRSGETKVLIALRTMTLGLDIPRLTAFFNISPTSNAPNFYQELCRVRTPFPGKHHAYLVDFLDDHYILENCFKTRTKVYNAENIKVVYG